MRVCRLGSCIHFSCGNEGKSDEARRTKASHYKITMGMVQYTASVTEIPRQHTETDKWLDKMCCSEAFNGSTNTEPHSGHNTKCNVSERDFKYISLNIVR